MIRKRRDARTRRAPGRSVLLCLALGACQLAGTGPRSGDTVRLPPVVLVPGPVSGSEEAEAAGLLRSAQGSLAANRYFEALRAASELIERFPSSSVSGQALLLSARAELGSGIMQGGDAEAAAMERARVAAERYVSLLAPGDPRGAEAYLIQAEALEDDPGGRLDRLLRIGASAPTEVVSRALPMAREAADVLDADQLEGALAGASAGARLAHVPRTRLAVYRLEDGDSLRASDLARVALEEGASGPDALVAEGVLRGELPVGRGRVTSATIATVLPVGGSPSLADFARLVAEGVEVAVATAPGGIELQVLELDDEGDPQRTAELVAELEAEGVAGVIGFLEDLTLELAGLSRQRGVPLISPTARSAARAGEGVYSLGGPDPRAASEVAAYAAWRGHRRVAILHPSSPEAEEEANAFQAAAERHGIPVVARFTYEPGATSFEAQIMGARDSLRLAEIAALGLREEDTLRVEMLEPVGLFLPIPPEDVEFVAPQIRHFALDTLAIEILGTSGWTDAQVLETVDLLYTDGVVATAPEGAGPDSPGQIRFREAYEEHFQQSLVSSVPALGYDATLLLLEALRQSRGTTPDQVVAGFERIEAVEGAMGIYSVVAALQAPGVAGPSAGPRVAGDSLGGMPVAGDSLGGMPVAGDTLRDAPMAADTVIAQQPLVGDTVPADPLGAAPVAGVPTQAGPIAGVRLIRHSEVVRIENGRLEPVEYGQPPPVGG